MLINVDIFNIVVGILGIISFIFSIWVLMRSDTKIRELMGVIKTIYSITGTAIWESQVTTAGDYEVRLRQAEKTLGFVSSIRELTGQYAIHKTHLRGEGEVDQLIERGIIWNLTMIMDLETSKEVTEIWLVTPDLKPDSSDEVTGRTVSENLKRGKSYVYFFPDDLPHSQAEIASLLKNIGLTDSRKLRDKVTLIPVSRTQHSHLFAGGNMIFYYSDVHRSLPPRCFEEIVLTQIPKRGYFWQEHAESKSNALRHLLDAELQKALKAPDQK